MPGPRLFRYREDAQSPVAPLGQSGSPSANLGSNQAWLAIARFYPGLLSRPRQTANKIAATTNVERRYMTDDTSEHPDAAFCDDTMQSVNQGNGEMKVPCTVH